MQDRRPEIEAFFEDYARRSDEALQVPPREDVEGVIGAFAPYFVGAGPMGVYGGANDETLRRIIPQGFARYREVGGKAMQITRLKITELDPFNAMARVDWLFSYERPADGRRGDIAFQNIYFLNFATGEPKIFAYVTPDEEQAMRDHGLV
jgi:hypothetical protein